MRYQRVHKQSLHAFIDLLPPLNVQWKKVSILQEHNRKQPIFNLDSNLLSIFLNWILTPKTAFLPLTLSKFQLILALPFVQYSYIFLDLKSKPLHQITKISDHFTTVAPLLRTHPFIKNRVLFSAYFQKQFPEEVQFLL